MNTTMIELAQQKVALLARVPILVQVKQRLAAEIGDTAAFQCYRELLNVALEAVSPFTTTLWLDQLDSQFSNSSFEIRIQPPGDLGVRIFTALKAGAKVLIGSDIPEISSEYIALAFQRLKEHEVVLGPTEDGGYCLIGMHKPRRDLFDNICWGQDSVLEETFSRIQRLNLSVSLLPKLWDVDDSASYIRWCESYRPRATNGTVE
ncbi:MAG: TIGR04282 family arsenosugar biosynthesis glycosyltransferase [Gammaproteobacteria bacterium]|nr:TIGR04282 family arsenosugar biosynthesis glycosyltransferase [Gammaproteobacteria bacterium]